MSLVKTKATKFHTTEQVVRFKPSYIRFDGLDKPDFPGLRIGVGLVGRIDGTEGDVEQFDAPALSRADVMGLTGPEKKTLRDAVAICAKLACAKVEEFEGIDYDAADELS